MSLVFVVESVNSFESIRESYVNQVNELNEELLAMKEAYDQLDAEKQLLTNELEKRSIESGRDQVRPSIGMFCCYLQRTS